MEQVLVGIIVGLWLVVFVLMSLAPFMVGRRAPDAPAKIVALDDRRRTPKRAA